MKQKFFTPPLGDIRPLPENKREAYNKKYNELGPFIKHKYDIDVCTLYRQMVDLNSKYDRIREHPYSDYVEHIKDNVLNDLHISKLDSDFFLHFFYCVVKPDHTGYISYLSLFFALSHPLTLIQHLEYHLNEFVALDHRKRDADAFLGILEHTICDSLRSNQFPEDWYAKHDKIINWIYAKRDMIRNETKLNQKIESIVYALNRIVPAAIPVTVLPLLDMAIIESRFSVSVTMRDILFEDIKEHFSEANHNSLQKFLAGKLASDIVMIFKGNANQIIDVFRIYKKDGHIDADSLVIAETISKHIMFKANEKSGPKLMEFNTASAILYGQRLPPKGKRIILSNLKQDQHKYYR